MMKNNIRNVLMRYLATTAGLFLVAVGVALSIESDLGTAPVSCPPYVAHLCGGALTVGEYTGLMHLLFIVFQMVLLGRRFKAAYLMQVPAAVVFGALTDIAIGAFSWLDISSYAGRLALTMAAVAVTALGVSMEVLPQAWMLAGEQTVWALSEKTGIRYDKMKVCFDVFLVVASAAFSFIFFRSPFGNGHEFVIREGTIIFAICTGLCMRLTDPLVKKMFGKIISGS